MGYFKTNRNYQQARWDEPIIMELGNKGERGILVPRASKTVRGKVGTVDKLLPADLKRKAAPKLPEMSQMQVLRHYMRLSQETIGTDINIDIGLGTCTMKYSPKINEQFVRSEKLSELHPCQDESTVQGILKIMYKLEQYLKAISGMDKVSLQAGGGSQAIFANVETIRRYHEGRGEGAQRDEIITTILSHPANPGAAATIGYKVITLYPGEGGLPDLKALEAVLSERTAALMITNPEDTGIYNGKIKEFVDAVHKVGGLCAYDQANLNGVFGITRAKEAGFDMCHYNLHKSFSSPHGCQGPAAGAQCVSEKLAGFIAVPTVEFDGENIILNTTARKVLAN
jgi:glycine dehydrogenase subunit 2